MSALASSRAVIESARRLGELEVVIEHGIKTFVEVGNALAEIRDSRLYKETHRSFDDYCQERWRFTKTRANQLIQAAEVTTVVAVPPKNEAQARELAPLLDKPAELQERMGSWGTRLT